MAKKNSVAYTVVVRDYAITSVVGDILQSNDKVILIRHRKQGSSKYAIKTIPAENVVGINGGVGKPSEVIYKGLVVFRRLKNCVVEPSKNGILVTHIDTNTEYTFNPLFVEAIAEKGVDTPSASLIYKKPKMGKGGRKKGSASSGEKKPKKKPAKAE
jgi:hypothetical protein